MKIELGKTPDKEAIKLDVGHLLTTKLLVTANSGGGKSWLLRLLFEGIGASTQLVILDVEGEFITLREKLDMVLVGPQGEIPAETRSAPLLVRRLMEKELSAVIDMSELKPGDRRAYVRRFCEAMLELPKQLWRPCFIGIDEAHVFCPEKGQGEAESTEAVNDLCSRSRKRGFCPILATQRISKLHKDAAAEANNKCIGRMTLDIDQKRAAFELGITPREAVKLRELKAGDFYCYGPAFAHDGVTLMKSGQVQTTHPKAGQGRTLKPPKPSSAILAMLDELKDLPQEAEQQIRDLSEARKKIAELERSLRMASRAAETPKPADKADPKAVIELRTINRAQAMQIKQLKQGMELAMKVMTKIDSRNFMAAGVDPAQIEEAIKRAAKEIVKLAEQKMTAKQQEFERWKKECQKALSIMQKLINAEEIQVQMNITHRDPVMIDSPRPARPAPTYDGPTDEAGRNSLTDVERDILDSAASFPNGATKKRLSIHSGRSIKSSSFGAVFAGGEAHPDKERASLVQRGLLQQEGDRYLVTEAGAALARPSSGVSLQDWYQKLQPSESNVLRCLVEAYPDRLTREEVAERTTTSIKSSSFGAAFPALRELELIEGKKDFAITESLREQMQ